MNNDSTFGSIAMSASIADIFCGVNVLGKVFSKEQDKYKLSGSLNKLCRLGKTSLCTCLPKPEIRDNICSAPALLEATESMATLMYVGYATMILTEDILQRYHNNQGYVYLIHAVGTDRYKIGRSINPPVRLETLKKQSPYPLQILECFWTPDAIADEKYFHNREYLAPHRKFGEWFEVSDEEDDTLSLSLFDVLQLEFTGHRPTCNQYLRQSFKLTIENTGLSTEGLFTEGRYSSELYQPLRLLYLAITNLSLFEKIVDFSFQTLPASIGTCRTAQELEDKAWAVCNTAAEILLGQDLFDIEQSTIRSKGN